MSESTPATMQTVKEDFNEAMEGILEPEQLEAIGHQLDAATTSYPANGNVASFIFYLQFQVNITSSGGKSFNGKAGGLTTPGGGALFGDVYTDDLNRLYESTVSFQFTATPVYLSLIFFDSHSNALGTFQAGGISTVTGVGGGSGKWS